MYTAYGREPRKPGHGVGPLGIIAAAVATVLVVFMLFCVWDARTGLRHAHEQNPPCPYHMTTGEELYNGCINQ